MKLQRYWLASFLCLALFVLLPGIAFGLGELGFWSFLKSGFGLDVRELSKLLAVAWFLLLPTGIVIASIAFFASRSKKLTPTAARTSVEGVNRSTDQIRIQARRLLIAGLLVIAVTVVSALALEALYHWFKFPYKPFRNDELASNIRKLANWVFVPFVLGIALAAAGAGILAFRRDKRGDPPDATQSGSGVGR